MEEAIFAEEQKKIALAAELYEKIIEREPCPPVDCYINLIIIYFVANDPGDRGYYGLSLDFTNRGNERLYKLFEMAKRCYPHSKELLFWENYVHFILYDTENFPEIDKQFCRQNETLVPFFYFYNEKNDSFFKENQLLYDQIKKGRTCKERYIKSILDAHWKRRGAYQK